MDAHFKKTLKRQQKYERTSKITQIRGKIEWVKLNSTKLKYFHTLDRAQATRAYKMRSAEKKYVEIINKTDQIASLKLQQYQLSRLCELKRTIRS